MLPKTDVRLIRCIAATIVAESPERNEVERGLAAKSVCAAQNKMMDKLLERMKHVMAAFYYLTLYFNC